MRDKPERALTPFLIFLALLQGGADAFLDLN